MKVVGLSGAQGGGKSSLLIELENRGWRLDKFRVSRAVQAELGWDSLERVMDSPETMVKFQMEVWQQKHNHDSMLWAKQWFEMESVRQNQIEAISDSEFAHRNEIVLTERTFADICAYSTHWGYKFADRNAWSDADAVSWAGAISHKCFASQKLYAGVILLPYMEDVVPWENDSHRAERATTDSIYESVQRFMETRNTYMIPRLTITAKSISDRADQVETFLRSL